MTTVSSTASTTSGTAAAKSSSLTSAADQEDRFMKLLVAQMKNQDPLNPMDNSQMTSQIAQINTVGGIQQLNETVKSLLGAFTTMQNQSVATDVAGRDVLVAGGKLQLASGKATGGVELASAADAVSVDIVGADGKSLRTMALGASPAGVRSFEWDGRDQAGNAVADGAYSLRVTATAAGKAVAATALTAQHVQAVDSDATGVVLDLGAAGLQPLANVKSYL